MNRTMRLFGLVAALLLLLMAALPAVAEDAFPDVPENFEAGPNPHHDNVTLTNDLGIFLGDTEGNFNPADPIRRDQAASAAARTLDVTAPKAAQHTNGDSQDISAGAFGSPIVVGTVTAPADSYGDHALVNAHATVSDQSGAPNNVVCYLVAGGDNIAVANEKVDGSADLANASLTPVAIAPSGDVDLACWADGDASVTDVVLTAVAVDLVE